MQDCNHGTAYAGCQPLRHDISQGCQMDVIPEIGLDLRITESLSVSVFSDSKMLFHVSFVVAC